VDRFDPVPRISPNEDLAVRFVIDDFLFKLYKINML
jgi:hypothetical protein